MSACMSGTRGSGVLSSTGDVLVRGVGGVCDMCVCLARGGVGVYATKQHHRNMLQSKQTTRTYNRSKLDMSKAFDTVNIHTPFSNSFQTTSKDATHTWQFTLRIKTITIVIQPLHC